MDKRLLTKKDKIEPKLIIEKQISNKFSNIRTVELIVFVVLLIASFFVNEKIRIFFYVGLSLTIIAFVITAIIHSKHLKLKKKYEVSLKVINFYQQRQDDSWKSEENESLDYINENLEKDLALTGKDSLYKYINVCKTKGAKRKLQKLLVQPDLDTVNNRQEIVKELHENFDFIFNFISSINENEKMNNIDFNNINESKDISFKSIFFYINCFTVLISVVSFVLGFFFSYFFVVFAISLILNFAFATICLLSNSKVYKLMDEVSIPLRSIVSNFDIVDNVSFINGELQTKLSDLRKYKKEIQSIATIAELDSFRKNFFAYLFLNICFPFVSLIGFLFHRKYNKSFDCVKKSTDIIEDFEVYSSLCSIGFIKEVYSLPTITKDIKLRLKDVRHPMIYESKCVPNSLNSNKEKIFIITGSNMSGKSSFLRTIAMNMTLMNAGSFVCASFFEVPLFKIFTSMSVSDNLNEGISTFHAELLRIKDMLNYSNENQIPFMAFIDEIFKGTNYKDRIFGAKSIINHFSTANGLTFITTHDLELCENETTNLVNYHFSEEYINDEMFFDYTLKDGICNSTNAKYLMTKIGIIKQ